MKTILIFLAIVLGSIYARAQKIKGTEVPASVKSAFEKKYPGAKVEKWEKEGLDFEAEFDMNKAECSALFDNTGNFKEFEQEMKQSALPKGVIEYCEKNFVGFKLTEASVITDSAGIVMYEAELNKGKDKFDAFFDDKGNFVKKSEPEKNKEEND